MVEENAASWPQVVAAVDPGGKHGLALATVRPDSALLLGAWEFADRNELLGRIEEWAAGGTLAHLVVEEFLLYPWQAQNLKFSEFPAPQTIGALLWLAHKYAVPVTMQKAAIMKGARKTAKARGLPMVDRSLGSGKGAYRGPDFDPKWLRDLFGVKSSQHTRDALAHLCHWVWTNEAAPAGRWRGKAHEAPTREQVLRGALLSLP